MIKSFHNGINISKYVSNDRQQELKNYVFKGRQQVALEYSLNNVNNAIKRFNKF